MFRTIWFYTFLILVTTITAVPLALWYILGWLGLRKAQRRLGNWTSYSWAHSLAWASGVKYRMNGLDNIPKDVPVLFVSNHQSNLDFAILLGLIKKPKAFVAKIELAKIPVVSPWMRNIGCVFMDRKDIRQSLKVMNEAAEIIRSGVSMVIFPEGTRSKSDIVAEFKKGSLKLADKAGVPIVPVAISGTYKAVEANRGWIKPVEVKVVISEPIYPDKLSKEEKDRIHEIVRDVIVKNK